jgi:serine/threonine protein kinase/formylglycine-generating enzyme required for sulfatase activity
MDPQPPLTFEGTAASTRRQVLRQICERFDEAWKGGQSPRLEDFLEEAPQDERTTLFNELLRVELCHRAGSGQEPRLTEYQARFPAFADCIASALAYVSASQTRPSTDAGLRGGPANAELEQHDSAASVRIDEETVPTRIGRYLVRRRLGTGSFGTVWLAEDETLLRQVAIKVPRRSRLASPASRAAFLREAQTAANLNHPAIVIIYDVGRFEEAGCYVVMEYIAGRSLQEEIAAKRPDFERAAAMMAQVADAAHHAHKQGLVHRDLKPANILLDAAGRPHVVDFGLAIHDEHQATRRGELCGTPPYMAPEQVRGESHRLDGRTDVWALGVVFYELLCGRRPFTAPVAYGLYEEIQERDPKPPRQIDETIPLELERICLKCLAKRMTDRHSTAADLAADLRHFLARSERVEPGSSLHVPRSELHAPVVPKGLRAFDAHDSDFFLQLLPGPTDRDGLPESIRFWKTRIEEIVPDGAFAVGVIYGPSGCGKSSLVKAGLLPRLAEHVEPIYVEATPEGTAERLLRALQHAKGVAAVATDTGAPPQATAARETPSKGPSDLVDTVATLRTGQVLPAGRKVLIVLDQFEQWLHAHHDGSEVELVCALRQCDGAHVQCLVLVRDDFWLAASRFMQALEVPLAEGRNSAMVDLFDALHARKVLALFGRAYGCLGTADERVEPDGTDHDRQRFLDRAISGLAENGKVVPVRLALFAQMVKAKPWSLATLKDVGGIAGVGATFLEETFGDTTAQPRHRIHQRAARAVLAALLPDFGTDLKGLRRTGTELLAASGYQRLEQFAELMQILDAELRLVTPAEEEETEQGTGNWEQGGESRKAASGTRSELPSSQQHVLSAPHSALRVPRSYQLTHDYLVPSLRDWLTRKQRETLRGRAEIRLAERAASWAARPEWRNLPAWWELVDIEVFTRGRRRAPAEHGLLRAARRHHGLRTAAAVAVLAVVVGAAREAYSRLDARALVRQLLVAATADVPGTVKQLARYRRQAEPLLRSTSTQTLDERQRLHVALALLPWDQEQLGPLRERLLAAAPYELPVIRDALQPYHHHVVGTLWKVFDDPVSSPAARLRAACALAAYDGDNPRWPQVAPGVAETLVAESPFDAEAWIEALRGVKRDLIPPLCSVFRDRNDERTAQRSMATAILTDYAAGAADLVTDLAADADRQQFRALLPVLKRQGDQARASLERVLDERAVADGHDTSLDPAWVPAARLAVEKIEAASGLVTEQFALCQTLALDDFAALAESLRPAGYRPVRLRPYADVDKHLTAAVWHRDGGEWQMAVGLAADEVRTRDKAMQAEDYMAVDVAGYVNSGDPSPKFAALWVRRTREAARLEIESVADGPPQAIVQQGFTLATLAPYNTPGGLHFAMTWSRQPGGSQHVGDICEATYRAALATDRLQVDVSLGAGDPSPPVKPDPATQLALAEKAVAARPASLAARFERAKAQFNSGNDQAAVEELSSLAEKAPNVFGIYQWRSQAYARLGRAAEARADVKRFQALVDSPTSGPYLEAVVSARLGADEEGLARLDAVVAQHEQDPWYLNDAACAYAVAAQVAAERESQQAAGARSATLRQRAMDLLVEAVARGYDDYVHLRDEDDFLTLRALPEFQRLLAQGHLERRYAAVFVPSGELVSRELHAMAPEEHLRRCRELAAAGWRPAAISLSRIPADGADLAKGVLATSVWHTGVVKPAEHERVCRRQANAATALLCLGQPERVWPLLVHSADPEARSWLIHRLAPLGAPATALVDRLLDESATVHGADGHDREADKISHVERVLFDRATSLRRALLLALGQFDESQFTPADRERLLPRIMEIYADDPDAGVHSAAGWLLRHWGQGGELLELDQRAILHGPNPPAQRPDVAAERRWYVNGQGQTMVIVEGPVEFLMGSPASEPGHRLIEPLHRRRVARSFAISAHEVTVEQLEHWRPGFSLVSKHALSGDGPVNLVTWYQATEYCNWLSEQERLPPDEWCYLPNAENKYAEGMKPAEDYLTRRGYRLPSEAEWEFAARAGAISSRFYGASDALLGEYAWFTNNSHNERLLEVGRLKPNDLGLFDVLGNVKEWCTERGRLDEGSLEAPYVRLDVAADDLRDLAELKSTDFRALRGGAFSDVAADLRSANRTGGRPASREANYGFRVARTHR